MPVLVGDKIFCHMPKTGGSSVTRFLLEQHGGKITAGHGHQPAHEIPRHLLERCSLFGTIRDPWSWYGSWWLHGMNNDICRERLEVYGGGSSLFPDVLSGAVEPQLDRIPEHPGAIWTTRQPEVDRRVLANSLGGLWSWTFWHIYGDSVRTLADMYRLPEAMEEIIGKGQGEFPKVNSRTDERRTLIVHSIRGLYTDDMVDAIWDADGALASLLGYEEPFKGLREPVLRM